MKAGFPDTVIWATTGQVRGKSVGHWGAKPHGRLVTREWSTMHGHAWPECGFFECRIQGRDQPVLEDIRVNVVT
jgi:hypothetical protein